MPVPLLSTARFHAALLAACIAAGPAAAEAQTGGVTGSVVDAQGLALPGVLVEIRTDDGVRAGSDVTDRIGAFAVAEIEPGPYRLTADLIGFETYETAIDVGPDGAEVAATLAIRQFTQELTVTGMMPDVATEQVVPARRIEQRVAQDLALSLREQTGVTAVRRGAVNLDPAVRGLYAEQIGVFVDGTRTFAAGPARMDSGLSHVSPHALQSVRVVRGPYALTWGPGALSAIRADTFRPAFADGDFRLNGRAGYNHGSNGGANDGYAGLWGSNGGLRFTFQHNTRRGGDYTDGNRDVVPGGYESYDTRWSLGGRLNERTLIEYSGGYQEQNDLDYPGRILDATYFHTRSHAVDLVHAPDAGPVREIAAQAYRNAKDHRMNNDAKPTAMDMAGRRPPFGLDIDLPASSDTTGGRFHVDLGRGALRSKVGADVYRLGQTAERTIARRSDGRVMFTDVVWPDARVTNTGAYGQLLYNRGRAALGGTLRVDDERADAGAVSTFFTEHAAGDLSQRNTNVSAAASLGLDVWANTVLNLGVGRAVRNPSVLERYSDRFPAVKFQTAAEFMGDPTLVPEKSRELNAGLVSVLGRLVTEFDFFYRVIDDYITVVPDAGVPKRLPLSPPVVFRYTQGGEARFIGFDVRTETPLGRWFDVHVSLSYVHAEDTFFDEPLFGIPPLEERYGFRVHTPDGGHWMEMVVTTQHGQDRVATTRFEVPTEGWTTADLHAGLAVSDGLTIRAGVRNLADRYYVNHLNSFNPFTGMRIAEVGRSTYVGAEYGF